jgi:hypothetical protein
MAWARIGSALSLAALLTACATRTVFVCADIPDIPRPSLPAIAEVDDCEDLPILDPEIVGTPYRLLDVGGECLTEKTWQKILRRDQLRRAYAEDLEATLRGLQRC